MKATKTLLAAALTLALAACGNDRDVDGDATMAGADGAATTIPADDTAGMAGTDASGMAGAGMAADPQRRALMVVEEVDRHEIAAAEDALAKNVEGDVRAYAEMLRDDHTRNLEATRRLMGGTGSTMGSGSAGAGGMDGTTAGTAGTAGSTTGAQGGTATSGTVASAQGGTGMDPGMGHAGGSDAELDAMRQKHEAERQRLSALEGEAFATAWVDAMVRGHEEALNRLDTQLIPEATDTGVAEHLRQTRTAIAKHLETGRALQSGDR